MRAPLWRRLLIGGLVAVLAFTGLAVGAPAPNASAAVTHNMNNPIRPKMLRTSRELVSRARARNVSVMTLSYTIVRSQPE